MKFIVIPLLLSGCTLLPAPLIYIGYAKTGVDTVQIVKGEPTTGDMLISQITNKECKTTNVFNNKDYCQETLDQKLQGYINSLKEN